ncbi:photosystem II S4 domain protein [Listeria grayi]|uniref:Photosystem II S4 domain protein n=1 Tax=Listeria grayi TaxID=1641 RepID=A0A378MGV0_LISGR|nr:RNA-binding protein [Listeria grayi]STY45568.1 photosystem II S4 domain protein [Listeria grayi]
MEGIYQHFRPEEYDFIDKMTALVAQVEDEYTPRLTHFLDPRQEFIVQTVIGSYENIKVAFNGGRAHTERVRALIYPDYYEPTETDFEIALFQIRYPVKFTTLTHQKILGTLMSLGMKRDIFGDILEKEDIWQFFVEASMKDYLSTQIEKIGKVNVMLEEVPLTDAILTHVDWIEKAITVSSLRLDVLIAVSHNISRQKAKQLVQGGLVRVNWKTIENADFLCVAEDIISVRGYGRIKLMETNGKSKKDKDKITIGYLQ